MATNFENAPILDKDGATVKVGGQEVTQGSDDIFHPTALPVSAIIQDTTVSLSTSNTDTGLSGLANLVMIDFGTNDPTSSVRLSGQHRTGGDFNKVAWFSAGDLIEAPRRHAYTNVTTYSTIPLHQLTTALDGARVIYVPSLGLNAIRLSVGSGTLADVRIVEIATATIPTPPPPAHVYAYALGDFTISNSPAYTSGDAVDTVAAMNISGSGPRQASGAPTIRSLSGGDYTSGGVLDDCDLVIGAPDGIADMTDNIAFDIDYPEGVIAWYELRTTPTGDQIPIRSYGTSGGNGFVIPDLDLLIPYVDFTGTSVHAFDVFIIARSAMNPGSATTVFMEAQVEL